MVNHPEQVTVIILSEEEGKELSVRYAARCLGRDIGMLIKAMARHARRYCRKSARGYRYTTLWWTREHTRVDR